MGWLSDRWNDIRNVEDSVKSNLSNLDDTRRENPLIAAMIPFTPENQALMAGGGALLSGGMALSGGLGALGAGSAAAGGAGAAGGLGLGNTLMGLGSIGAGLYGANQASKGVDAQIAAGDRAALLEKESADKQLELQRQIWEKQQADYKPYLEQGTWGINRLGDLMRNQTAQKSPTRYLLNGRQAISKPSGTSQSGGFLNNPFDSYLASKGLAGGKFDTSNPAYQFQLQQGQRALDNSAAARGMGYSGAQMKASQQYGQGLASQEYDKQYNRANSEFGDYYNRLAGLSQGGQQAAGSMAQAGSQYANNASNTFGNLSNAQTGILGQQANARASGYAANANALNGTLNSLTNLYGMSKWGK